jgi:hypothetical protein
LRSLARLLNPKPNRRRNEPSRRRWRSDWRCGHWGRSLFDCLFDNRRFFNWRRFGHDHDLRCFIDFNGWRRFDFYDR